MKKLILLAVLLMSIFTGCFDDSGEFDSDSISAYDQNFYSSNMSEQDLEYRPLAEYWAPRFYHDVDDTDYKSELMTKFNFDGDYKGNNNWESMDDYNMGDDELKTYVYYSVVETDNFYFIGYYTFHPRDWSNINTSLTSHENDLEGVLLSVKKTGSGEFGTLISATSEAHDNFYQYKAPGAAVSNGTDDIDATLSLYDGHHPEMFIEAKGHGVYNWDGSSAPGGDGVVYTVDSYEADSPVNCTGSWSNVYRYQLISMDNSTGDQGLWYRRNEIGNDNTFSKWGTFRGDTFKENSANMPWIWDDSNDGEVFSGDMMSDPAHFVDCQLNGSDLSDMSHNYINNIYKTHSIKIIAVRSDSNRDSWGGKSDLFVQVTATGAGQGSDLLLDNRSWKRDDANKGTYYTFQYGANDADGETEYGDVIQSHYFSRYGTPSITVSVYDHDSWSGNDLMGSITLTDSADYSSGIDLGDARIKFVLTKY
ncbi:MAG: hypothetical protein GY754_36205 [bacterium]|nr:hypothetical protein [bacterium]